MVIQSLKHPQEITTKSNTITIDLLQTITMDEVEITEYYELPGFEMIYLEDSYVLGLTVQLDKVEILIDAVLREGHRDYVPPVSGRQYCYHLARIIFTGFKKVMLSDINSHATTDIDGEADYGNIEVFCRFENQFYLSGEWGKCDIVGGKAEIVLELASEPVVPSDN